MKTSATQIVILGIFILFLVVGVISFSMTGGSDSESQGEPVAIWGTFDEETIGRLINSLNTGNNQVINAYYTQIGESDFEQSLIEALADGVGPDVVLIPNTFLLKNQKKLLLIGSESLSIRDYKDSFTEGSEIFLTSKGTYSVPVLTDPMVMYWNRDILTSKNVARAPQTWEEILSVAELLTERREDRSIIKSGLAMGDYSNILFAKDILATLIIQSGGKLVERDQYDDAVNYLNSNEGYELNPLMNALIFFAQFSDPLKSIYSWNRSLPDSETAFVNGDLAIFFAPVSEASKIRERNPNLNFDIAMMPQPKNGNIKKTSGTIYGFSILETSKNPQGAFNAIKILTSSKVASALSEGLGLPPARRDLLEVVPSNAFGSIFWRSALITRGWLDPNVKETDIIFKNAVDAIVAGKNKPEDSAKIISKQVSEIFR